MEIPGLPLVEHLPLPRPSGGAALLLLGGDDIQADAVRRAGYRVDRHALDTRPIVEPPGVPFTPPVVVWPFADAAYDAVILLDELALVVREEAALAEAARVLRPGGVLLLRVPATGRLAWLDGDNAYRYVREITRRGLPRPASLGAGWRRHYSRRDLRDLLQPNFRVRAIRAAGLGMSDAARLGLLFVWRWALRSRRGDAAIRHVPRHLARHEGAVSLAGRGYWLVAAAERLPEP
jgi:SAM-dependent methyltransferase